jgi:hypothetical protein
VTYHAESFERMRGKMERDSHIEVVHPNWTESVQNLIDTFWSSPLSTPYMGVQFKFFLGEFTWGSEPAAKRSLTIRPLVLEP